MCMSIMCLDGIITSTRHQIRPILNNKHTRTSSTVLPRLSIPRLSETSIIRTEFRTWSLFKKVVFLIKIAVSATEQSTCVCVSYVHVQCRHTVVRHRVQCEL